MSIKWKSLASVRWLEEPEGRATYPPDMVRKEDWMI